MCLGGGPVGPQKYSGGSNVGGDNNTAHEEMMSKAMDSSAARRDERALSSREAGTYGKTDKRTGKKSLISTIKSMF